MQETQRQVEQLARQIVEGEGLELVDVALKGPPGRQMLRLDIDRAGPVGVDIEDCQRVSRALGAKLDALDPIHGRYLLEVSSPGVDRPIRTPDDFRRNTGRRVVIQAVGPEGRERRIRGVLRGCDATAVLVSADDGAEHRVALDQVRGIRQDAESDLQRRIPHRNPRRNGML